MRVASPVGMPEASAEKGSGLLLCGVGTPYRDFEIPSTPADTTVYVNVASFFDRRRRSNATHYFVKYFAPEPATRLRFEGIGMRVYGTLGRDNLPAVGVVLTSRSKPVFPTPEQLRNLQDVAIDGQGRSVETCVNLADNDIFLEADQAAWIVVNFPDAAPNVFTGILADVSPPGSTNPDRSGDFMTRDTGDLWYRPDPHVFPKYDWALTVYATPLTRKAQDTWTGVKRLYR